MGEGECECECEWCDVRVNGMTVLLRAFSLTFLQLSCSAQVTMLVRHFVFTRFVCTVLWCVVLCCVVLCWSKGCSACLYCTVRCAVSCPSHSPSLSRFVVW